MRILNLGCGNRVFGDPGSVNHDVIKHRPEIHVAHDLNNLPWPWGDNSFDYISARAVFEHLRHDLVVSMNECWRILAPGGIIDLKLPYWRHDHAYDDPTHRWQFGPGVFQFFDPESKHGKNYAFYTDRHWKILKSGFCKGSDNSTGNESSLCAQLQVRK